MLGFKRLGWLFGALAAVWLAARPAEASVVQALGLDDLVEEADRILLGRVVFSESFQRSNGMIGTWHRIEVERNVRGGSADDGEVIIETLGGQLGDIAMRVEGEPSFSVGERVIVFGREAGSLQALRPIGMGQGVMRVRVEEGIEMVRQSRQGMMLMRRNADGRLEKSLGALPRKETLDSFLSRIQTLVEEKAGTGDH